MGYYDTFHGQCPTCRKYVEHQTKAFQTGDYCHWFVGVTIPELVEGEGPCSYTIELCDCYECGSPVYANVDRDRFVGFSSVYPRRDLLYSDKARREEIKARVIRWKSQLGLER